MTKAEERALEFYPKKDYNKEPNYIHTCDSEMLDEVYREVFILGYKQAEKDLGWISVKERLPETDGYYFTCSDVSGVPQCIGATFFSTKRKAWEDEYGELHVDFWMPCPELPKK